MSRRWWFKATFLIVGTLLCTLYVLPSIVPEGSLGFLGDKVFKSRVRLGLDLQGGMHLVYSVKVDKAVIDKVERYGEDIEDELKKKKLAYERVSRIEGRFALLVAAPTPGDIEKFETEVFKKEDYNNLFRIGERQDGGKSLELIMLDSLVDDTRRKAVDQARETIRNRVDKLGVVEASITKLAGNDIQVQLPGIKEKERAKDLIGQPAQLEFKIVDDDNDFIGQIDEKALPANIKKKTERVEAGSGRKDVSYLVGAKKEELAEFIKNLKTPKLPSDHQIGYGQYEEENSPSKKYRTYYLHRKTRLTGEYITDAQVRIDEQKNKPYVGLDFNRPGAKLFETITGENVKRRMAIILDDEINSAPVIQDRIAGGRAQITLGGFKVYDQLLQEAKDLSLVLRAGALPAPIQLQEERTVGATLGQESIENGSRGLLVGITIVFLFCMLYYRFVGIVTALGLFANLLVLITLIVMIGATLTLPGIFGIVLTIGMAVDANVIINERIRDELRLGKTPRVAVELGYTKAFSAIFDANVTTAIACFVLWQYGSGPLRGFAVVTLIGLVTSMFTSVWVTRVIMEWVVGRPHKRLETLSI
jgi:preprotein translocase subunit SecD